MNRAWIGIAFLAFALGCARKGSEKLIEFKDPAGTFFAEVPDGWSRLGNIDRKDKFAVRWVQFTGPVRVYDEGRPLGASFKVSRFVTERADYPGNETEYHNYMKVLVLPKLAALKGDDPKSASLSVAGLPAVFKTSRFDYTNRVHLKETVPLAVKSVLVKDDKAIFEIELIATQEWFPNYEPLFDRALNGFKLVH
jgi:hypothetical protein